MLRSLSLLAAVLSLSGCSKDGDFRKTYSVSGTIAIDGVAAEPGIIVALHPQYEETDKYPIHPKGETAAGGSFKITTYNTDDGAPEGDYIATVEWPQRVGMSPHFGGDLFGGAFGKIDANKSRPEFNVKVTKEGAILKLALTLTAEQKKGLEVAKQKAAKQTSGFNLSGQ